MYSMVLMMAMASGPDTVAAHGRGGCHGAQAGCHGVQAAACCAAPVAYAAPVSYGCHGSSCHGGGYGGGCYGGNSCHGGGRGGLFHRRSNGCHGSTVSSCCAPVAANCCGAGVMVAPAGAPPAIMPAPMGEKKGS
jgi:hypothetical protein